MIQPFAALEQCLMNEIRFLKRAVARAADDAVGLGQGEKCRSVDLARPLMALDLARQAAEEGAARRQAQSSSRISSACRDIAAERAANLVPAMPP